ncbi:MAG: hypothetical protein M3O26_06115 [Pseudomonadota bacterium]|nr:hypothetical protein [Pseudomonadota bacterium]
MVFLVRIAACLTMRVDAAVSASVTIPVYTQNPGGTAYPGLPDLPALTFTGSTSLNPGADHAPQVRNFRELVLADTMSYSDAASVIAASSSKTNPAFAGYF